jgi:hypothetical protein
MYNCQRHYVHNLHEILHQMRYRATDILLHDSVEQTARLIGPIPTKLMLLDNSYKECGLSSPNLTH